MNQLSKIEGFMLSNEKITPKYLESLQEHFGDFFAFLWFNVLHNTTVNSKINTLKKDYIEKLQYRFNELSNNVVRYKKLEINALTYSGIEQSIFEYGNLCELNPKNAFVDLNIKSMLKKYIGINGIDNDTIKYTQTAVENYFLYKKYYPKSEVNPWEGLYDLFLQGFLLKISYTTTHVNLYIISATDTKFIAYNKFNYAYTFKLIANVLQSISEYIVKFSKKKEFVFKTDSIQKKGETQDVELDEQILSINSNISKKDKAYIKFNLTEYFFYIKNTKAGFYYSAQDFDVVQNNLQKIPSKKKIGLIIQHLEDNLQQSKKLLKLDTFEKISSKLLEIRQEYTQELNTNSNYTRDLLYYFFKEYAGIFPTTHDNYTLFPVWLWKQSENKIEMFSLIDFVKTNLRDKKHTYIFEKTCEMFDFSYGLGMTEKRE